VFTSTIIFFRGNRSTKFNAEGFDAFASHKYPPLVEVGINFVVNWSNVRNAPHRLKGFSVAPNMNRNVAVLKLFPGMTPMIIRNLLQPPLEGCVLESYGSGNCPNHPEFLAAIKEAIDRGVIIVNITQCAKGTVTIDYESGVSLLEIGVIPGGDMTTEAAMTKLAWLLGQKFSKEKIKKKITHPMRGELTQQNHQYSMTDTKLVDAFITTLGIGHQGEEASEALAGARNTMLPMVMCSAAGQGNILQLQQLCKHVNVLGIADYDSRTPLHISASEGRFEAVKFLVERGADVNAHDRWGSSPLDDALRHHNNEKIVKYLEANGAKCRSTSSGSTTDNNFINNTNTNNSINNSVNTN